MPICLNESHYPQLELPAEFDQRLHNYDTGTPCMFQHRSALVRQPFYLRAFTTLIETRYPAGSYGHSVAVAILAELRSHATSARRQGKCLMCGGR